MKHTVAEDALSERAALYALGALNQHEARAFEEHIEEGCPVCEAELRPFESVVATIGFAAPEAEPPRDARDKLLASLAESDGDETRPILPRELPPQADLSRFLTVRSISQLSPKIGSRLAARTKACASRPKPDEKALDLPI